MAQIKIIPIESKSLWEDFLSTHPESNFLQSWNWGQFHQNFGNQIFRTGFYANDTIVGVMLSVVENAKRGRYLTVPGGPIINWQDISQVNAFKNDIKTIAQITNCVFIRVRPQLTSDEFSQKTFSSLGFIPAPVHLHAELTSQLDITASEEELLANMRKATRYEVKKALNLGIKVTSTDNPEEIQSFYNLQLQTAKRQGFVPFSYKFLYEQFKAFASDQKALLYSAYFEDKLLAQAFIIFYGKEADYHYGASTKEGREYPGAYLIQWEAIKEAKRRNLKRYNFWGIAPEDQKNHRFQGLSIFKRGFGGLDFEYLHAQDLVISKPRYLINLSIENVRKKIRHI